MQLTKCRLNKRKVKARRIYSTGYISTSSILSNISSSNTSHKIMELAINRNKMIKSKKKVKVYMKKMETRLMKMKT